MATCEVCGEFHREADGRCLKHRRETPAEKPKKAKAKDDVGTETK